MKNRINSWQIKHMRRIKRTVANADRVIAATAEDADFIEKHYHKEACVIPETGAVTGYGGRIHSVDEGILRVAWCGVMDGRKALDLALKALAEIKANLDAGLIDRKTAGTLAAQAQKAQSAKELEEVRQEGRMQLARYNQGAATAREIMKQDRMDNRSNKKKKTYPILTFRTRDGRKTKSYDPNDDRELLQYYRDGVELGIFKDLTKESDNFEIDGISYSIGGKGNGFNARNLNPDMLRNYIFYNLDRYNKVTNQNQAMDMFGDGLSGLLADQVAEIVG